MANSQSFIGRLDERWADQHSTFTVEMSTDSTEQPQLIKTEGPLFYQLIDFTHKQFVEPLAIGAVPQIAETIVRLPKTYERIGIYRVDVDDELQALTVEDATAGDTIVFTYQAGDDVTELYRGVLGHNALQPV